MAKNHYSKLAPAKSRGRPPGSPNKITRAALRDLAEGNADRVQSWLDSVAEKDPAEALRLWLGVLRYVTPTLQAAAIADVTPSKPLAHQLAAMSEGELLEFIVRSPEAAELVTEGVTSKDDLLQRLASSSPHKSLPAPTGKRPKGKRATLSTEDDDLLR